jgi:DNA-binding transcriptional MerR regulator
MEAELWTLAELADRVAGALSSGYRGQRSARIADVPDIRSIRYYTTLGLLDRPAEMRGRTALYGRRHLWQLVAIKRRQAAGCTLAEIQQELAGAPDSALQRLADLPDEGFWRRVPSATAPPEPAPSHTPATAAPKRSASDPLTYQAVPLDSGAIVLIPRRATLTDDDIAALRAAAGALDTVIGRLPKGLS